MRRGEARSPTLLYLGIELMEGPESASAPLLIPQIELL